MYYIVIIMFFCYRIHECVDIKSYDKDSKIFWTVLNGVILHVLLPKQLLCNIITSYIDGSGQTQSLCY